jgi:ATP-dependent protease ClpP protease subunit
MKKLVFIIAYLLITVYCLADTFTHKKTGEVFRGYATGEKKGGRTLVRVGDKQKPKYLNLLDYDIEWNQSGRRNQIIILPIKNEIELECETRVFEKAIRSTSNQGPLLVIIEIDTPGGQWDLMKRFCDAIISTDNCRTVAFISGGKYGGAYSAGAFIALACDYIYMADGTAIGAAAHILGSDSEIKDVKSTYGETVGEKFISANRAYIASLAEQNGRSGLLAKAMADRDIEVWEVVEDGKTIFIAPEDKKISQTVQHVWSKKGSLLTLTAAEACKCGMANRILNSEEEIISEFGFEKPKVVCNQDIKKAREEFENAKDKVIKLYNEIDYLRKDIDLKLSQFIDVTAAYNHAVEVLNYYKSRRYHHYNPTYQRELVNKLLFQRNTLKSALTGALADLKSKYTGIISLNKVYTDLHIDVEEVNKEINTIDVLQENIKENPFFSVEVTQRFRQYQRPVGWH